MSENSLHHQIDIGVVVYHLPNPRFTTIDVGDAMLKGYRLSSDSALPGLGAYLSVAASFLPGMFTLKVRHEGQHRNANILGEIDLSKETDYIRNRRNATNEQSLRSHVFKRGLPIWLPSRQNVRPSRAQDLFHPPSPGRPSPQWPDFFADIVLACGRVSIC
jgi:hypothetical protein